MSVTRRGLVDTSVEHAGIGGVALRGRIIELTVFPDAGGKILELVHRPSGVNLLWQNPRIPLRRTYAGAAFDDVWCGGWDELFPTDAPCELDGNTYHDHGDLWIGPWEWDIEHDNEHSAVLYLRRHSASLPCLMERWIQLERDSSRVEIRYRLSNVGVRAVPFVWNVHVAHAISADSRLHLPAHSLGVRPPYFGRADGIATDVSWPHFQNAAGIRQDLGAMPPPQSGLTEFLFTRDLEEGWCAVTYPQLDLGLALSFDLAVFPQLWLFGVYGGWRGHYVLLTEPSTGRPGSLADNVAAGIEATLEAGSSLETTVVAEVLTEEDVRALVAADVRQGRNG